MTSAPRQLLTPRFLKFCTVGASGVVVNLACLGLLADLIGLNQNLSAALAIEFSINTNFLVNELWTFRDRRSRAGKPSRRWIKFHLVSAVGAALQWVTFVIANFALASVLDAEWSLADGADVGSWIYVSQLAGIALATFWNFFANVYWTWKQREEKVE
ncbi:MAG: GtrA family protein [Deltaproteobacteria bacterium]|nr:GtrA family protein [Deltaproteobacteria bacterium]